MVRIRSRRLALVVVLLSLATASSANAGPFGWIFPSESQPNSYSPINYDAPRLVRLKAYFHGPKVDVYPPDRHPEIPADYNILRFPCAAADASATLFERPSPPATSKFRY